MATMNPEAVSAAAIFSMLAPLRHRPCNNITPSAALMVKEDNRKIAIEMINRIMATRLAVGC